jgi:hypothetical protein
MGLIAKVGWQSNIFWTLLLVVMVVVVVLTYCLNAERTF